MEKKSKATITTGIMIALNLIVMATRATDIMYFSVRILMETN
jgi:hypothetical protein